MIDESTRINAVSAYLFLGPFMLLARAGTPLGEAYVQAHARRASIIMLLGFIALGLYFFLKQYLIFGIFGISLATIVLILIMSIFLMVLLAGAYGAFRGVDARETSWRPLALPPTEIYEGTYSEENKIRIIASFFPFIGSVIAARYPMHETQAGQKVGNFFMFLIITSIAFIAGGIATLTLIITLAYIALVVATAVYLFSSSRFLEMGIYRAIPSYLQIDAYIKATIVHIWAFFRIAFGGEKTLTYRERYEMYLQANQIERQPENPYFAPLWMVAIPVVNLLTLPSFFSEKYREYRPLILQGLFVTLLLLLIVWRYGWGSEMGLYLFFPIVTLIVYAPRNTLTRAPITSMMVDIYQLFTRGKTQVAEMQKQQETAKFSYIDEGK